MTPATVTRLLTLALLIAGLPSLAACGERQPPHTPPVVKPDPGPRPMVEPAPPPAAPPSEPKPAEAPQAYAPAIGAALTDWSFIGNKKLNHWKVGKVTLDPSEPKKLLVAPDGTDLATDALMGVNLYTKRKFGDCRIELEAMIPQGGNSGIFLMGEYELQILDDPTTDPAKPTDMDFGAIARIAAPKAWAHEGAGKWQRFEIVVIAPRFDAAGKKTANAKVSATINGKVVHENLELPEPTAGGLYGEDRATGPLMLQGNEGPAAFRNIRVTPLD